MRTDTEIKLLQVRQSYRDQLVQEKKAPVTNLRTYEMALIRYRICNDWLHSYKKQLEQGRVHDVQESI